MIQVGFVFPVLGFSIGDGYFNVFPSDPEVPETLPDFQPVFPLTLSSQRCKPVAIRTRRRFLILEMQDEDWIYSTHEFLIDPDSPDHILETTSFGEGDRIIEILLHLDNTRENQGNLDSFLQQRTDGVCVHYYNRGLYVQNNIHQFLGISNDREQTLEFLGEEFIEIDLDYKNTYYLIETEDYPLIIKVDRMGNLLEVKSFMTTQIQFGQEQTRNPNLESRLTGYSKIYIPYNLQAGDSRLSNVENWVADFYLEKLLSQGLSMCSYRKIGPRESNIYFRMNIHTPFYQKYPQIPLFRDLQDSLCIPEIPSGDLVLLSFNLPIDCPEIVLISDRNHALVCSREGKFNTIRISPLEFTPDLEVYSLENSGQLYQELRNRIQSGQYFTMDSLIEGIIPNIVVPNSEGTKFCDSNLRLSYQKLLGHLYNLTQPEPKMLEGYRRSDEIPSDQIIQKQTPILLQPFAGPPGTIHRLSTLTLQDGDKVFIIE